MGFVVATESVLRPRAYSSPRALAYFLEKGVRLDRQVSFMLRLVGESSGQRFTANSVRV